MPTPKPSRIRAVLIAPLLAFATSCSSFVSDFMLPKGATSELSHFDVEAPSEGTRIPDGLVVEDLDGTPVRLDSLIGDRPFVLTFGSYSCPVVRYRLPLLNKLAEDFGEDIDFAMVYTLESHPVGSPCPYTGEEWDTMFNVLAGVRIEQPSSLEQRRETARATALEVDSQIQVLVDSMSNEVWSAFGRAPTPAFVFDSNGLITMRQVWFDPSALRVELDRLTASTEASPTTSPQSLRDRAD